jgi:hypothetical protein
MNKIAWLALLTLFALVGCSAPAVVVPTAASYSDLAISMKRGACFGSCPVYNLTIDADGGVTYEGIMFVKVEGKRTSKLRSEQVKELVNAIQESGFFKLKDEYAAPVTDMPSINLTITLQGQTKSIRHYGNLTCKGDLDEAPPELCNLEGKIVDNVDVDQWVKEP